MSDEGEGGGGPRKIDTGAGDPAKTGKYAAWTAVAAIVASLVNGGLAFVGWDSAKSIRQYEEEAKKRLVEITTVAHQGYQLYARSLERDFIELVANGPGVEATGTAADALNATVENYLRTLDTLEKGIAEENRAPTRHLVQAYSHLVKGQCAPALESLGKYPVEIAAKIHLLAVAHWRCNDVQKAIDLNNRLRTMTVIRPSDRIKAKALANIGNAFTVKSDFTEAERCYREALKADPTLYNVRYNLAVMYVKMNRFDRAIQELCIYATFYDSDVVEDMQRDKDDDFRPLLKELGTDGVRLRLSECQVTGR